MAGRGGLNLTHSEPLPAFSRAMASASRSCAAIDGFPPDALRDWSEALGQPTFVGSSGRVFPKAFKASPLLRAWLRRLDAMGVRFALRHRWTGWNERRPGFRQPGRRTHRRCRRDRAGTRRRELAAARLRWCVDRNARGEGRHIAPLRPANCGFTVAWSEIFRDRFEGQPLKGVALRSARTPCAAKR